MHRRTLTEGQGILLPLHDSTTNYILVSKASAYIWFKQERQEKKNMITWINTVLDIGSTLLTKEELLPHKYLCKKGDLNDQKQDNV